MQNNYSEVFFDLDGTIIHSHEGICNAAKYVLGKKNIIVESDESLKRLIGPPLYHSFINIYGFSDEEAKECVEIYREYYGTKGVYEYKLIPGMDTVIKKLFKGGRRIFLATGKPQLYAEQIIKDLGLSCYFEGIVGSNMDGTRITKTEVLEETLKISNPKNPVMVGDSCYDVMAANEFNIDSIAVTFGYGSKNSLEIENPTFMADNVAELSDFLNVFIS